MKRNNNNCKSSVTSPDWKTGHFLLSPSSNQAVCNLCKFLPKGTCVNSHFFTFWILHFSYVFAIVEKCFVSIISFWKLKLFTSLFFIKTLLMIMQKTISLYTFRFITIFIELQYYNSVFFNKYFEVDTFGGPFLLEVLKFHPL